MRVKDLLARELVSVDADSPIHEIAAKMKTQDVGMVAVLSAGRPVGVVTDRDLVLRVLAPINESSMMTAWDVMTRDPVIIDEDATLERATDLMRQRHVRRLVIVRHDGLPIGVVSLSDLSRYSEKALDLLRFLATKPQPLPYSEFASASTIII